MRTPKPPATIAVPPQAVKGINPALDAHLALGTCHQPILECVGDSRNVHTAGIKRRAHVLKRVFIVDTHASEAVETPDSRLFYARRPFQGDLIVWYID